MLWVGHVVVVVSAITTVVDSEGSIIMDLASADMHAVETTAANDSGTHLARRHEVVCNDPVCMNGVCCNGPGCMHRPAPAGEGALNWNNQRTGDHDSYKEFEMSLKPCDHTDSLIVLERKKSKYVKLNIMRKEWEDKFVVDICRAHHRKCFPSGICHAGAVEFNRNKQKECDLLIRMKQEKQRQMEALAAREEARPQTQQEIAEQNERKLLLEQEIAQKEAADLALQERARQFDAFKEIGTNLDDKDLMDLVTKDEQKQPWYRDTVVPRSFPTRKDIKEGLKLIRQKETGERASSKQLEMIYKVLNLDNPYKEGKLFSILAKNELEKKIQGLDAAAANEREKKREEKKSKRLKAAAHAAIAAARAANSIAKGSKAQAAMAAAKAAN